jgi:hypothetical protein
VEAETYSDCIALGIIRSQNLLTWADSDDFACFVPALLACGPQPFDVAVGASRVGDTAQAPHRRAAFHITVTVINRVPLTG